MKQGKINDIEVIDHLEIKPLVVCVNMLKPNSYTVFRPNGIEREVIVKDCVVKNGTYQLTRNEIHYFESGAYKKLKENL